MLSLHEALIVRLASRSLDYECYSYLNRWLLECERPYVIPAERVLLNVIKEKIIKTIIYFRASDMFDAWLIADIIESTCTRESQERIILWMRESNY